MSLSDVDFRDVMSRWPSGVAVLTIAGTDRLKSALVTSLTSASLDPPLVQVGLGRTSRTRAALSCAGEQQVTISILAERPGDDLAGVIQSVEHALGSGALTAHPAVMSSMSCAVYDVLPAGDHDIVLLHVRSAHRHPHLSPAVYHDRELKGLHPSPHHQHDRRP